MIQRSHTHEQAVTLARIWLYGLFFSEFMEARPYLVVTGASDSGKTSLFQMINVLLSGPDASVQALPADRPAFENIVSNAHHIFFDNVDDQIGRRWLMDALAEVATGIQFNRRVLYSTNETITFKVQCSLGFTHTRPLVLTSRYLHPDHSAQCRTERLKEKPDHAS